MPLTYQNVNPYIVFRQSFIADLLPSEAVVLSPQSVIYILQKRLQQQFHTAFDPQQTIKSPVQNQNTEGGIFPKTKNQNPNPNTAWLKTTNMVGVNVRTIGSFWNVVKYALTLPKAQDAVHLLPIWEPGVVASLYGMSSWNVNPEFFSSELAWAMPHLDTVEKQLKVVVNILHALGKTVGMDVIPHTDRFAEQVLANPKMFEWLQRIGNQIVRHEDNLHEVVEDLIFAFFQKSLARGLGDDPSVFLGSKHDFFEKTSESDRLKMLFGEPSDYGGRLARREGFIQMLYDNHFETVPATMGPPYRGLRVSEAESARVVDEKGREWRDFEMTKPEKFSRVFGPLARYKFYENHDNNAAWQLDFDRPNIAAFEYVAAHYADVQAAYNFDFMRGDMAHVQPRPDGVPAEKPPFYDPLDFIKHYVSERNNAPHFGSFAETFLAPPNEMAYGDEVAHLEMSDSDSTLGDLQSMVVGSPRFLTEFRRYLDILHNRHVAPNFTIMTADKDDPRFDEFYLRGNEARFFIALFLPEMPSYMGLGFEQRDPHPTPAPNEHYTKLYVFHLDEGKNATHGNYVFGQNRQLVERLNQMRLFSEKIHDALQNAEVQWLILPDVHQKVVAWTAAGYGFVVNLDIQNETKSFKSKISTPQYKSLFEASKCQFSTLGDVSDWENLAAGEGRIYRF